MKTILTLILILPLFCFAQKKQDVTAKNTKTDDTNAMLTLSGSPPGTTLLNGHINFSPYEKSKVEEHDNLVKQFNTIVKNFKAMDSTYWKFINDELQINKIDFSRLSQHPDSLKIDDKGIFYILKPKKK